MTWSETNSFIIALRSRHKKSELNGLRTLVKVERETFPGRTNSTIDISPHQRQSQYIKTVSWIYGEFEESPAQIS